MLKKTLDLQTSKKHEVIDITDQIEAAIEGAKGDTFAQVFVPHTTACVLINEHDDALIEDLERVEDVLLQDARPFKHCGRDGANGEGHAFCWLHGPEQLLPVEDGKLALGHLQRIFFVETDGPRQRHVEVRVMGQ
jgi:secondary thiamine-phosphate synthase enzyme